MLLENLQKENRKEIGAIALSGLVCALIIPDSLKVFTEANRILFTTSTELRNIAEVLEIEVSTLRKSVCAYLESQGIDCGKYKH